MGPGDRPFSFPESGRDRGEREKKTEGGGPGPSQCGNNSDPRSRKVAWEVALRWRHRGWEGAERWCFYGTGVMGQSWTEITLWDALWPRPGCLGRKDKLPGWTARRQALGKRAGGCGIAGAVGSLQAIARPKPEQNTPSGTRAGCGAEPEAWPSVTCHLSSLHSATLFRWKEGCVPALTGRAGGVGADRASG